MNKLMADYIFGTSATHILTTNNNIKIFGTVILPVVLYGHKTWFLTLREHILGCSRQCAGGGIWA